MFTQDIPVKAVYEFQTFGESFYSDGSTTVQACYFLITPLIQAE